ncbi:Perakine reductase [Morella rubra]|uniref:Perakine reductase n=1 Tax=Morella rubra TaxID=262757 RepID=A0A6A1VYT7_9ROSI|nr:Perakine reductase [Morella rubra]
MDTLSRLSSGTLRIMEERHQVKIPRVKLGSQGLEVSRLGYGCAGLSGLYNTPLTPEAGFHVIKEAFDRGITFFDTSDLYGHEYHNEIMIGKPAMDTLSRLSSGTLRIMEERHQVKIPRVKLGSQGLEVSRLGYGCAGLSGLYNTPLTPEAGFHVIKEAFDRGITFFDTSDLYGHEYHNEIMIGKALKQLPRDKVQLATKFGVVKLEGDRYGQYGVRGSPEYVRKSCEASLKRLEVDYIDLYYPHRIDVTVPIEDTAAFNLDGCLLCLSTSTRKMGELKKLVDEGKIKYIGLSEASVDTIRRAHAVHPITALQMEYSLWARDIEDEIVPVCRELGIGIVAYSPLGRGFFGGKAVTESLPTGSILPMFPRFSGENLEKNKILYRKLAILAEKRACTTPQLALAWLLHQGEDVVPIPGTTQVRNLHNNIGSLALKLSEDDLKEICDAVPVDEVVGERQTAILSRLAWKFANTPPR